MGSGLIGLSEKNGETEKGGLAARRIHCELLREHPYFTRKRGGLVAALQRASAFDQANARAGSAG
jgi:hypothetical protein